MTCRSLWQTPLAFQRTSTSCGPGSSTSTSSITSGCLTWYRTAAVACVVMAVSSPPSGYYFLRGSSAGSTNRVRSGPGVAGAELAADDLRAADQGGELLLHDPARRLPETAIRVQPELVGRHAAEQGADARGHVLGRLRLERFHVDDTGAQLQVRRPLLEPRGVLEPTVGELEDDLRGRELAEH